MNWKRCDVCHDMKNLSEYWKQGNSYRNTCKSCMKLIYNNPEKKQKKKEYDKARYEKNKSIKKDIIICMRCDKYQANVRNNQLYWCFNCLEKYEREWKQKIKVEVILKTTKKIKFTF